MAQQSSEKTAITSPGAWSPRAMLRAVPQATGNKDEYTFKMPGHAPCWDIRDLQVGNMDILVTLLSACRTPKTHTLDKSHNTTAVATLGNSAMAPPCQHHNPSQAETSQRSCSQQRHVNSRKGSSVSVVLTISRCSALPAVDSSQLHPRQCQPKLEPKKEGPRETWTTL